MRDGQAGLGHPPWLGGGVGGGQGKQQATLNRGCPLQDQKPRAVPAFAFVTTIRSFAFYGPLCGANVSPKPYALNPKP